MTTALEKDIRDACGSARKAATEYPNFDRKIETKTDPVAVVLKWFDLLVKTYLEPDNEISTAYNDVADRARDLGNASENAREAARTRLQQAIDELERVAIARGRPNKKGEKKWHPLPNI